MKTPIFTYRFFNYNPWQGGRPTILLMMNSMMLLITIILVMLLITLTSIKRLTSISMMIQPKTFIILLTSSLLIALLTMLTRMKTRTSVNIMLQRLISFCSASIVIMLLISLLCLRWKLKKPQGCTPEAWNIRSEFYRLMWSSFSDTVSSLSDFRTNNWER